MSGPIVVGVPGGVGRAVARTVADVMPGGTLVWSDPAALRDVCDDLTADWDVLVVRGDDEGFSTAAMSHRAQVHGEPPVVIVACDEAASSETTAEALAITTMVLRHLGVVQVLLVGDLEKEWEPTRIELELDPPVLATVDTIAAVLTELVDVDSINHDSPEVQAATYQAAPAKPHTEHVHEAEAR